MATDDQDDDDSRFRALLNVELTDRELHFIGTIVAQWGALEYQVFEQTFLTFSDPSEVLPPEMNNLQFSKLLDIWSERVISSADSRRKKVLTEQLRLIRQYLDYRNALVHGMWSWELTAPHKIKTMRVRKKQLLTFHFTADDLEHFALVVAEINAKVRWPGGTEDLAREHRNGYMSRSFVSAVIKPSGEKDG